MVRSKQSRRSGLTALLVVISLVAAACGGGNSDNNNSSNNNNSDNSNNSNNNSECDGDAVCTVALDEPGGPPITGGSIIFGVVAETNSWSPSTGQWASSGNLISQTFYDRLALYDSNNEPTPYLAESITSNDTFDKWTIVLRPDIKFSDGSDLDAEVVKANLLAIKDSFLTGPIFGLLEDIDVVDDLTLVANMSGPWSTFRHSLTAQPGSIASRDTLDGIGDSPVGTGPFEFVEWTRDNELKVKKNPNYWRDGFPLLENITFRVITDGQARASAMQSGDLDLMETSEFNSLKTFYEDSKKGDYQFYVASDGDTDENFVMFNTTKPPFNDPILRKAAIQAIDPEKIANDVYEGVFEVAQGPISPDSEWYAETDYPEYDPVAAKAAIEKWEADNGRPMSFEANVPPDPSVLRIGQLIKAMAEKVGVDVKLNTIEQTVLIVNALSGDYESTGFAQIFNVTHPDLMYPFLHSSSIPDDPTSGTSLNFPRYANDAIDAALDGARATDDKDEQYQFYKQLQEALAADTPYLWLVHTKSAVVTRTDVRAITTWQFPDGTEGKGQIGSNVMLYQVWLDR